MTRRLCSRSRCNGVTSRLPTRCPYLEEQLSHGREHRAADIQSQPLPEFRPPASTARVAKMLSEPTPRSVCKTENTWDLNGGYDLGFASDGDFAVYKKVDFGGGVSSVNVRLACNGNCGGNVEFRLGGVSGTLIASATIPATGRWQNWQTINANASSASGIHDLYVIFTAEPGGSSSLGNLNWFQFQ